MSIVRVSQPPLGGRASKRGRRNGNQAVWTKKKRHSWTGGCKASGFEKARIEQEGRVVVTGVKDEAARPWIMKWRCHGLENKVRS